MVELDLMATEIFPSNSSRNNNYSHLTIMILEMERQLLYEI